MSKVKSNKTQPSRTQTGKVHARNAQPKHAYMYTSDNDHKHVRQPIAHKNSAYRNFAPRISAHYHCNCMSHSIPQKDYRKHPPQ